MPRVVEVERGRRRGCKGERTRGERGETRTNGQKNGLHGEEKESQRIKGSEHMSQISSTQCRGPGTLRSSGEIGLAAMRPRLPFGPVAMLTDSRARPRRTGFGWHGDCVGKCLSWPSLMSPATKSLGPRAAVVAWCPQWNGSNPWTHSANSSPRWPNYRVPLRYPSPAWLAAANLGICVLENVSDAASSID